MKKAGRIVLSVAIISILSRVLALFSNIIYITYFGSTTQMNIFKYALQMPNTIFNSFGTALNLVVIPVYTGFLARGEDKDAKEFLDNIISIVSVLSIILVILGIIFAPQIGLITDYKNDVEEYRFLIYSLRVLMPVMFFLGLNYIFQGILQANNIFRLPAMVSIPTSIITIGYTIFFGSKYGVKGLVTASLLGLVAQPLILIPMVKKVGYRYKPRFNIKDPHIIEVFKNTLPVLVSASAYQINTLFSISIATRFDTVVLMNFTQEICIVSILTIIYSITSVYFPRLTKLWAVEDKGGFRKTLNSIISIVMLILIPAGFGFFILRFEIMDILLNYRGMAEESLIVGGNMLGIYGLSVLFIGLKEILDRAFYSQRDTKTPAIFGFIIMVSNIIVTYLTINIFGTYSMPIAYLISALIGTLGLFILIHKRTGVIDISLIETFIKCSISGIIMTLIIIVEKSLISDLYIGGDFVTRLVKIIIYVLTGIIVYFVSAILLKEDTVYEFIDNIKNREAR